MTRAGVEGSPPQHVTYVAMPPFQAWPEVVMWGERFFVFSNQQADANLGVHAVYTEIFCYAIPPNQTL